MIYFPSAEKTNEFNLWQLATQPLMKSQEDWFALLKVEQNRIQNKKIMFMKYLRLFRISLLLT